MKFGDFMAEPKQRPKSGYKALKGIFLVARDIKTKSRLRRDLLFAVGIGYADITKKDRGDLGRQFFIQASLRLFLGRLYN